jgi:lipopolysaccharide/colanic/teichoic acid biosynthesis glycosyltransferase
MQTFYNQPARSEEPALAAQLLNLPARNGTGKRKNLLSAGRSSGLKTVHHFMDLPSRGISVPRFALMSKRLIDMIASAAGLVLMSPMLALIAALIKFDSAGPALYSAPRAGKNGRTFTCYKFRTMIHNADSMKAGLRSRNERQGAFFKMSRDPRITRFGGVLRRYSLDEIPQLWNVLRGDMSLVGPRPHPLDDFSFYVPQDLRRLYVTPGITGLWQVTARRDPSFQRNIALDLEYIERWTLLMDFKILYKTIFAVVRGTGA